MFDTIFGLPVHALVVHAVVVLVPLMCLITLAVSFKPEWRTRFSLWVVGANAVVFLLALAGKESGEQLQYRLSVAAGRPIAEQHGEYGDLLPWFALGLLVASALVWFAAPRGGMLIPTALLAVVVTALSTIGWTVLVGDTGARAVWEDVITSTDTAINNP